MVDFKRLVLAGSLFALIGFNFETHPNNKLYYGLMGSLGGFGGGLAWNELARKTRLDYATSDEYKSDIWPQAANRVTRLLGSIAAGFATGAVFGMVRYNPTILQYITKYRIAQVQDHALMRVDYSNAARLRQNVHLLYGNAKFCQPGFVAYENIKDLSQGLCEATEDLKDVLPADPALAKRHYPINSEHYTYSDQYIKNRELFETHQTADDLCIQLAAKKRLIERLK